MIMVSSNRRSADSILRVIKVACFLFIVLALSSVFSGGVAKEADEGSVASFHSSVQEAFDEAIEGRIRPDRRSILLTYTMYREYWLGTDLVSNVSDDKLLLVYKAVSPVVSLYPSEEIIEGLSGIVYEVERRALDVDVSSRLRSSDPVQFLYEAYLTARQYESATRVADQYGVQERFHAFEALNGRPEKSQAALLRIEKEDSEWQVTVAPFDLNDGPQIIVVAHPDCGPSRQAMEYFESDENLSRDFLDRVQWVVPQSRTFPVSPIQEWNEAHDRVELSVLYDEDQWPPSIGTTGTPVFFFMKDGERKGFVEGWPDDGQFDELASVARSIGIAVE